LWWHIRPNNKLEIKNDRPVFSVSNGPSGIGFFAVSKKAADVDDLTISRTRGRADTTTMMRCKQVVTTLYRASSKAKAPSLVARFTTKATTIDLGPAEMLRSYMQDFRTKDSLEPIPFTNDIAVVPLNDSPNQIFHKKVSIIGCGQVGMGIAFALLNQTAAGTIALVDMDASKLEAEAKDLEQGSGFHEHVRILAGTGYEVSAHSHLVIVTAGVAQKPGESRLNLMEKNVAIMKNIIPNVLAHSPDAAICIVSNPCDIMTAVAAKIAGSSVPAGRIFGSGTCLDSSRLQSLIAKTLKIDARAVQGYVVGEHGDNSVPLWSSVRVGGVHMIQPGQEPEDIHRAMHHEIVNAAYDVIKKKVRKRQSMYSLYMRLHLNPPISL
jgi:L-lactate dehydrogenase